MNRFARIACGFLVVALVVTLAATLWQPARAEGDRGVVAGRLRPVPGRGHACALGGAAPLPPAAATAPFADIAIGILVSKSYFSKKISLGREE